MSLKHQLLFLLFSQIAFSFTKNVNAQQIYSQDKFPWDANLPNYDDRLLHYGFTLGINSTRFRTIQSSSFFNDSTYSIRSKSLGGFNLGFVVNMRISKYFDARLLPGVAFYTREIKYTFLKGTTSTQAIESVFIEVPLLLKYKSQRRKNHRLYMVGGIKTAIEAGAKKKERKNSELRTNNLDFSVDYGFGIDLYFKYFKFAPELRFSHGLVNILNRDPNIYSQSLSKLTSHTITLYLFFE